VGLVVLAVTAAAGARADEVYLGIGGGNVQVPNAPVRSSTWNWMLGYRFHDRDFALQAVGLFQDQTWHQPPVSSGPPSYDFNRFAGLQGVAYWQLTPFWDVYASFGGGRAEYTSATTGAGTQTKSDTLEGIGLRWQVLTHLGVAFDLSHINGADVTAPQLRAELTF
jgi:hypothetical protein